MSREPENISLHPVLFWLWHWSLGFEVLKEFSPKLPRSGNNDVHKMCLGTFRHPTNFPVRPPCARPASWCGNSRQSNDTSLAAGPLTIAAGFEIRPQILVSPSLQGVPGHAARLPPPPARRALLRHPVSARPNFMKTFFCLTRMGFHFWRGRKMQVDRKSSFVTMDLMWFPRSFFTIRTCL